MKWFSRKIGWKLRRRRKSRRSRRELRRKRNINIEGLK